MSAIRRAAVLWIASVILLAAASAPAFAEAPTGTRCGSACGQEALVTRTGSPGTRSSVESCIRDAGCGGGASLTTTAMTLLLAFAAGSTVVICALAIRRYRSVHLFESTRSVFAGRLFRPPRFALGS